MKKRNILFTLLAMMLVLSGPVSSVFPAEKEYPNKPIQIILPHSAGGGIDIYLRLLAEELKKTWKVPVNILNKPGGGGVIAASEVANAPKDGYTLLGMLLGQLAALTVADPKKQVDLKRDYDPLAVKSYASMVIVVRNESNFKSFDDVLDYARKKPGELIIGTSELGSTIYLEAVLLNRYANVKITIVPLQGTSEIIPNVLGGHFQLGFINDVLAKPQVASGKMRPLVGDAKSLHFDCPTFAEKGYPQVALTNAMSIMGPKGLPPAVAKEWETTLGVIMKDPDFITAYKKLGFNIGMITGKERLEKRVNEEIEKYSNFTPEELGWKKK